MSVPSQTDKFACRCAPAIPCSRINVAKYCRSAGKNVGGRPRRRFFAMTIPSLFPVRDFDAYCGQQPEVQPPDELDENDPVRGTDCEVPVPDDRPDDATESEESSLG